MKAESFDPRRIVQEPEAADYYVVIFWSTDRTHAEEWKLADSDVEEVVIWAREQAGANSFEVLAHFSSGYLRLKGVDR
ncbi:MAG TPA: hypothetical protein PKE40_05540 [Arachnia sp.]|nr:hypothetical protein [Arachnia sp.]HMT85797.1 hypothetical protein [Arachnia sp.]